MSGGRSTVAHRKGKRLATQAGDISSIHPLGNAFTERFLIECKAYRSLDFDKLIKGKGNLLAFWDEAKMQAARYHKLPLLIGKQNQFPEVVCMTTLGLREFHRNTSAMVMIVPPADLHIMLLTDFLALTPWRKR